jgi:hypothetical protein
MIERMGRLVPFLPFATYGTTIGEVARKEAIAAYVESLRAAVRAEVEAVLRERE